MTITCNGCGVTVEPLAVFPGDLCLDCCYYRIMAALATIAGGEVR